MIFFSFSLYGSDIIYNKGMVINAKIISERFPTSRVQVYIAEDVPADTILELIELPNVKLKYVKNKQGILNMFDRFTAVDDPECSIMFVRDADSRIHERDIGCIEDFLISDKLLHIIRDHPYHKSHIMGGLWGIRRSALEIPMSDMIEKWLSDKIDFSYLIDQQFLREIVYPLLKSSAMIHDRFNLYESSDKLTPFRINIQDELFCGQVHCFDSDNNEYTKFLKD